MNRQGQVIRKLKPPQWDRQGAPGCHELRVSPRGIIDAVVSPDGTKVAYVAVAEFDSPGCTRLINHNQVRVVNIDCTNPHDLETTADGTGDPANPSWLSTSRLLLSGPGNEVYFVDLPGHLATRWELVGREPDMKAGRLVGHGWSTEATYNMYVFTAIGAPIAPVFRCHYDDATGGFFASPSWAPDGTGLVWTESDGDVNEAGEGLWIMSVGDLTAGCPAANARRLLVPGGRSPHWGPASVGTPAFSVNDGSVVEGNPGTTTATFTVSRTSGVGTASVAWSTTNGTAVAGSDFVGVAPTRVTFDHLQTTKSIWDRHRLGQLGHRERHGAGRGGLRGCERYAGHPRRRANERECLGDRLGRLDRRAPRELLRQAHGAAPGHHRRRHREGSPWSTTTPKLPDHRGVSPRL